MRPTELQSIKDIFYQVETGKIAPKPEVWRGVSFRSGLEVTFAKYLDGRGLEWTYEPSIYGGYLPDFEIAWQMQRTFIEVKPTLAEVPAAQTKMAAIWRVHPQALLIVACWEGVSFFASLASGPWETWQERWG